MAGVSAQLCAIANDKISFKMLFLLYALIANIELSVTLNAYVPQARVVGGETALANSAPYAVSLQVKGVHFCGGSILNENWILTAAHCFPSKSQALNTDVVAGSNYVAGTAATTQKVKVIAYTNNDLYVGGTNPYDIAVAQVSPAFKFSNAIKAISLPTTNTVPSGKATLYGWGSTSTTSNPSYPQQLQVAANLPIISLADCAQALGDKGKDVHKTNLCTGPLTGGVGICTSDSGGPLVQNNVLIGVVSWGKIPCGQINSPSVFVQVSSFNTWIQNNMKSKKN